MFVRKKKNLSGLVSVQVIDKSRVKYVLERVMSIYNNEISVDNAIQIAKTITTLKIRLPKSKTLMTKTLLLTEKQKSIAYLFDDKFWNLI